ncbi:MAG TPA: phospholipid carrier-dependent glycosyltransferase [Solirubrobacteraceae bacterium]|nr:phospholipid carrier-dependent glycosyltransferase [Solirubrobacteraceae bacterium]
MPLQDFLAGTALFAAMLAAVGVATALVVRRRLAHLDGLERALAAIVIGTTVLIAVHLVPLMLTILSRGTVLAACAVAIGLAALVRPVTGAAAAREPAPEPLAPSGTPAWVLAGTAAAFAALAALADLARWAGDELVGVDPLTFHLPNVARWIQTGSVWQIDQFVPLLAHGDYPHNGDVVLLSTVLPWHNDFLVRLPITFFLATAAVAAYAVARELRAPRAACLLAAAAAVSLPVVGIATIPRALPDSLMWTTYGCGVLFLLRHARSARRSDLVLAGVALGIACGTKWYGVSSVAVVVGIWALARLVAARGGAGPGRVPRALGDAVLVGGLTLGGIVVWLIRNWTLSGNPVFPLHVAPFGITIFDAPPDVIRNQVGFTIADYAGDAHVLRQLAGEMVQGLGVIPIVCGLAIAGAVVLARRRGRADVPVLLMAAGAVLLAGVYVITPATALGAKGDPSLAHANTRYAVPALLLALPVVAWVAGRLPRAASLALQAALAIGALYGAYEGYELQGAKDVVLGGAGVAALAALAWGVWRLRARRAVLVVAAIGAAVVGLAAGHRIEQRINDGRYLGSDPAIDTLLHAAPTGKRIGLAADWTVAGLTPIWPAFGTRMGNDVEYVGHFVRGFLTPYSDERDFQAALVRRRYDLLVVGRGFFPPQPTREQRWALDAGWRTIALSRRLRVLVAPPAPR